MDELPSVSGSCAASLRRVIVCAGLAAAIHASARFMREEAERWAGVIKAAGVRLD
jgi:hypothetical protein